MARTFRVHVLMTGWQARQTTRENVTLPHHVKEKRSEGDLYTPQTWFMWRIMKQGRPMIDFRGRFAPALIHEMQTLWAQKIFVVRWNCTP